MRITATDLAAQFVRARDVWWFVDGLHDRYGLIPWLLYAVGSRETNLRNVVGDGGHGHGVWQLDDRFHTIPAGFDDDVAAQAEVAAAMLAALFARYLDWTRACNAYNSGSPDTSATTGGDYGPDVMDRRLFLANMITASPAWGDRKVWENFRVQGSGTLPIICPVGKASAVVASAWVSACSDGPLGGSVRFWFQSDTSGISDATRSISFTNGRSDRPWVSVPDGTTMIRVEYQLLSGGTVCVETRAKP